MIWSSVDEQCLFDLHWYSSQWLAMVVVVAKIRQVKWQSPLNEIFSIEEQQYEEE